MGKYRLILWVLIAAMIACIVTGVLILRNNAAPKIVEIRTEEDLLQLLDKSTSPARVRAALTEDITLNTVFEPCSFVGTIDGCGHTVTIGNNQINKLFDSVAEGSTVINLIIKGTFGFSDNEDAYGICDSNCGSIENCCVLANCCASLRAFGICRDNKGSISNCAVLGKSFQTQSGKYVCLQILQDNTGIVENSFYRKDESTPSENAVGTGLEGSECTDGSLAAKLDDFARSHSGYVSWKTGPDGLPLLFTDIPSVAASVFSIGTETLWLLCMIVVLALLMIYTIYYFDVRKKYYGQKEAEA